VSLSPAARSHTEATTHQSMPSTKYLDFQHKHQSAPVGSCNIVNRALHCTRAWGSGRPSRVTVCATIVWSGVSGGPVWARLLGLRGCARACSHVAAPLRPCHGALPPSRCRFTAPANRYNTPSQHAHQSGGNRARAGGMVPPLQVAALWKGGKGRTFRGNGTRILSRTYQTPLVRA
jgi:hypothetical protein